MFGDKDVGLNFTTLNAGKAKINITDNNGGDVVRDFAVGALGVGTGLQAIAAGVVVIDGKIDILDGKIDDLAADTGGAHFG